MRKAREALEKEVDILRLIRSRRFVHMALKQLLDPTLHKELKAKSMFKDVEDNHADPLALKLEKDSSN